MTVCDVELWVEARDGRPAVNPVMTALLAALREDGLAVDVRVPEQRPPDAGAPGPGLVLLKSMSTISLAAAAALEATGTAVLNRAATTARVVDKAATTARLAAGGLPVPDTRLLGADARPVDGAPGWVTKPVHGWHGQGVRHHETLADACAAPAAVTSGGVLLDDGTRLVQRRIGTPGVPDLKVYVAGERVVAGRKVFGTSSYRSDAVDPVRVDEDLAGLVLAVGETLDLRVFGVDLRAGDDGPAVVDVNPFPGFRGFPEVVPALLDEVGRARKEA